MQSDNSYSPSESEVFLNSYNEDAPPIPQKLTTKSYQNMMKVFLHENYEREPLDLKLKDVECTNCGVLHKRRKLNKYKVCTSGKCIRTIFGVFPACFPDSPKNNWTVCDLYRFTTGSNVLTRHICTRDIKEQQTCP